MFLFPSLIHTCHTLTTIDSQVVVYTNSSKSAPSLREDQASFQSPKKNLVSRYPRSDVADSRRRVLHHISAMSRTPIHSPSHNRSFLARSRAPLWITCHSRDVYQRASARPAPWQQSARPVGKPVVAAASVHTRASPPKLDFV